MHGTHARVRISEPKPKYGRAKLACIAMHLDARCQMLNWRLKQLTTHQAPGSWYMMPERITKMLNGRPFSPKTGDRRVVLAEPLDPNDLNVTFPRSTQPRNEPASQRPPHPKHNHRSEYRRCRIDKPGWIVLTVPIVLFGSEFTDARFSCVEPANSGLTALLQKRAAAATRLHSP